MFYSLTLSFIYIYLNCRINFVLGINEKIAPLVPWSVAEKKLPWGVMLLLGGGFALAHISEVICIVTAFETRLTRRVPTVEQELRTLPEHMSSPPVFNVGSCYLIFSFMCNVLLIVVCLFVLFLLAIVLSLLLFTIFN